MAEYKYEYVLPPNLAEYEYEYRSSLISLEDEMYDLEDSDIFASDNEEEEILFHINDYNDEEDETDDEKHSVDSDTEQLCKKLKFLHINLTKYSGKKFEYPNIFGLNKKPEYEYEYIRTL